LSRDDVGIGEGYYEECVLRILSPPRAKKSAKKVHAEDEDFDDDVSTVAGAEFADTDNLDSDPRYEGWKAKYKVPIRACSIRNVHRRDVHVQVKYIEIKHDRTFVFNSEEEASSFAQMVDAQKEAEEKRSSIKLKHALDGIRTEPGEEVTLLVEIVSGADLPVADISSSDPFVICYFNGKEVHRTKHISKR
jgi:hypothetical protein